MTVSFIIPFRDHLELLDACLTTLVSVLGSNDEVEVVLIDNGSERDALSHFAAPPQLRVALIHAPGDFNFQTLCNSGARAARGELLFFLNNDIVFGERSRGFLERMSECARKANVGAVGNLLFYPDGTMQHAGAVVGMNRYADHLYRGWSEKEASQFPFAQPREDRWVSAVTAASLLVERRKFEEVGGFDERFTVCGGDVDLCLRLNRAGYRTVYLGSVEMIHLESKSRDPSRVPKSDFAESDRSYGGYLAEHSGRDPFYPAPLPLAHSAPPRSLRDRAKKWVTAGLASSHAKVATARARFDRQPVESLAAEYIGKARRRLGQKKRGLARKVSSVSLTNSLTRPIRTVQVDLLNPKPRLNVILPVLRDRDIFGGLLTASLLAMKFKAAHPAIDLRFLLSDGPGDSATLRRALAPFFGKELNDLRFDVVSVVDREHEVATVHAADVFLATAWWTSYLAQAAVPRPFIYLIQDFEPGFHPWGDDFAASLATYEMNFSAIFNTSTLRDFFAQRGIIPARTMTSSVSFQPAFVPRHAQQRAKKAKRTLFVYGRRSASRNLFTTAVLGLAKAIADGIIDTEIWRFVSAGEFHEPILLPQGARLESLGKLSAERYTAFIDQVDLAISLMLSPHPSYPPLEVATAGALCVTNRFANKEPTALHPNLVDCAPSIDGVAEGIGRALKRLPDHDFTAQPSSAFPTNWDVALLPAIAHVADHFTQLANANSTHDS